MPPSEFQNFADDLGTAIISFLESSKRNSDFKSIYNKGMAAHKLLAAWSPDNPELLSSAAGAARRTVALLCIRQYSLVNVELRRFIECIIWYLYFADHHVEWEVLKNNPSRDWRKKPTKPIETAANAPTNHYFSYIHERMATEPSGLAKSAIDIFRNEYSVVSDYIHGAQPAVEGSLALTYDREDPQQHKIMKRRCFQIFKSGCILVAALKKNLLDDLNTTDRGVFDKLVSPSTARKIHQKPFGLPLS